MTEQRELTQSEIDNAPDWAIEYFICANGEVLFLNYAGSICESKPIPRKETNTTTKVIGPYKLWCDIINDNNGPAEYCYFTQIDEDEAIKIAKHFGLIK